MNIFVTDPDPHVCAIALDDKRLNKMTVETAQLLSTVIHKRCAEFGQDVPPDLYKPTHPAHPCTIWAGTSQHNFLWLTVHGMALSFEWRRRFSWHASSEVIADCHGSLHLIPDAPATPFVNVTDYPELDVFDAYRACLNHKWAHDKRRPRWTNAQPPAWRT